MEIGIWKDVKIKCEGKLIEGSYCVSDWMITVRMTDGRNKSTYLGDSEPDTLAKSLLRELAKS